MKIVHKGGAVIRVLGLLIASGATAVAVGLAAPAEAQPLPRAPFKNCTQAKDAGYCNIPSSSDMYGPWLDRDGDGLGCEC